MGSRPKVKQSEPEIRMRHRQAEEMARLDEEENRRIKGLARSRLGSRSLLGAVRVSGSSSGGRSGGSIQPNRPSGKVVY
jgi:hypothetical protein